MNAILQDEHCAEEFNSPAAQLLADLRMEIAPSTLAGYMPDGVTLRQNGLWLAELEARLENAERDNATLRTRFRYVGTAMVAVALACLVAGKALGAFL